MKRYCMAIVVGCLMARISFGQTPTTQPPVARSESAATQIESAVPATDGTLDFETMRPKVSTVPINRLTAVTDLGHWEIDQCLFANGRIVCLFTVTPAGDSHRHTLILGEYLDACVAVAIDGSEFEASKATIGRISGTRFVTSRLTEGVPIKCAVEFTADANPNMLKMLRLSGTNRRSLPDRSHPFEVVFRDIPLTEMQPDITEGNERQELERQ